jgi:hypothetical protein
VQSLGIEVADFLAVRPEERGDDDGVPVELERVVGCSIASIGL